VYLCFLALRHMKKNENKDEFRTRKINGANRETETSRVELNLKLQERTSYLEG